MVLTKTPIQVSDQVIWILKANVESHQRTIRLPFGNAAQRRRVGWNREAFETAPAETEPEMLKPVDEPSALLAVSTLEDEGEETGRATIVPCPVRMSGAIG